MNNYSNEAMRFTAWASIIGGLFAYLNVGFMLMVTQGDMAVTLQGATMLTLPAEARQYFRLSMFADILGFYLPVLAVGAYFWREFRDEAGALGDMALLAIATYVVLGVTGAGLQLTGSEALRAGAEAAWTTIAVGSQRGLWWCEGPVVLFWGIVVGRYLKNAGWGSSVLLPLKVVGWCFGLYFVSGFFAALDPLTNALLVLVVLIFPFWLVLFGLQLRRRALRLPLGA
ncbi:hypothetical protein RIN61_23245 [Pseudomonas inefficax]|uniref:hypothetical protein n=1 Tax=Pseudomonas inefficax TaxID=2078786 RepID=UPI0028BF07E2|nr:hypothetical protein [Pseudomonas inefficax]WNN39074.1 hypothetical protein RIN61_23245 [Pseudomonas inefficax]